MAAGGGRVSFFQVCGIREAAHSSVEGPTPIYMQAEQRGLSGLETQHMKLKEKWLRDRGRIGGDIMGVDLFKTHMEI